MGGTRAPLLLTAILLAAAAAPILPGGTAQTSSDRDPTVVATFDTGTNPFHPCFRRPGADATQAGIPGFPSDARALDLTFADTYDASLQASQEALDGIEDGPLYHIPDTNLMFRGPRGELVDTYPHGAQASSQIVCEEFGMAPDAWLVVLNYFNDTTTRADKLQWVAQQPWIDVVHLNAQDVPLPYSGLISEGVEAIVDSGKLLAVAAGNGVAGYLVNYPTEVSRMAGPPGSLVVGANDNSGWTVYSNLDPHVVADGGATRAAAPDSFGTESFSGTSSASPRATGHAAEALDRVRERFAGETVDQPGTLVALSNEATPPAIGPLADGALTAEELHETIRKTADPAPGYSSYDDEPSAYAVPEPVDTSYAVYAKEGYGEVNEYTLEDAVDVLTGETPMPMRPWADRFYNASETVRETWW